MADCRKLVPIIIHWEAGVPMAGLPNEVMFEEARKKGFANDPIDNGGATMIGITLNTFKAYRKAHGKKTPTVRDLKAITYEEWYDILKTMFWDKMKADQIENQSIANLCVNTVWGSGAGYIKTIQGVLGVKRDGIVGNITLGAINGYTPQKTLFEKLWKRREKFFNDVVARSVAAYEKKVGRPATEVEKLRYTQKKFLKCWLNRLNSFKFYE
jgi:lysozyme family protein